MVSKLDENNKIDEAEIKNQFDNHDTENKENLDKVEFATAFHEILKHLKGDADDYDEDEQNVD